MKSKTTRSRVEQIEDSPKLMHLVEKLMQLARAEANIAISETPYDLLRVLDIIVEDFRRSDLSSHRLVYERDARSSLVKMINEDMFAIVMRNLIENALLHGAQDQPVRVLVGSDATIQVINGVQR
ncbi:HAMP domain-containing histidine kinase [Ochrobactrum grignonense]|nr:HAMP domain-containing histidine kinase [Brucella grignonensis]